MPRKWNSWDDKMLELANANDEAAALFALKWRRLSAYLDEVDDEKLNELWNQVSDALLAYMHAEDAKKEHGLKMLVKWAKIGERLSHKRD